MNIYDTPLEETAKKGESWKEGGRRSEGREERKSGLAARKVWP